MSIGTFLVRRVGEEATQPFSIIDERTDPSMLKNRFLHSLRYRGVGRRHFGIAAPSEH